MIAKDTEGAQVALYAAQDFGDPAQARPLVDDVAGERDQVAIQLVGPIHHKLEEVLCQVPGEMEVGQVDDGQAIQAGRQPGHEQRFDVGFQIEDLVARQASQQPGRRIAAGQAAEAFGDRLDLPLAANELGRRTFPFPPTPSHDCHHAPNAAQPEVHPARGAAGHPRSQVELRRRIERPLHEDRGGKAEQHGEDRQFEQVQQPHAQAQGMQAAERPDPQRQVTEDRQQARQDVVDFGRHSFCHSNNVSMTCSNWSTRNGLCTKAFSCSPSWRHLTTIWPRSQP